MRRAGGASTRAAPGPHLPVEPPAGLRAERLDLGSLELALLDWPAPPPDDAALTPAERAVVALALGDLSNRAIAARRRTSPRTVANQLASAYAKLGVSSRAELASWAARGGRRP